MDYERQLKKLQARIVKLEKELYTDELTQVLNRRGLLTQLRSVFDAVLFEKNNPRKRRSLVITALSVIFVDIDHFKKINDTFGHAAGDEALKKVASILQEGVRGLDAVGRWGGEEMIVTLLGANQEDAVRIAETLRERIEATPIVLDHATMHLTASFGVAELARDKSAEELLDRADKALYQAKETGRNKVVAAK